MRCSGIVTVSMERLEKGASAWSVAAREDTVAVEEALEVVVVLVDGESVLSHVFMRTPGHDEELVLGWLWSEGIIKFPREVLEIGQIKECHIRVVLSLEHPIQWDRIKRSVVGSSSCGICGTKNLTALRYLPFEPIRGVEWSVDPDILVGGITVLNDEKSLFSKTGGIHGGALMTRKGKVSLIREDVGRHNVVDKLVGWGVEKRRRGEGQWPFELLMVSSRLSFDLVQKCIAAQIPVLIGLGAASSQAVKLSTDYGVTLVGFTKRTKFNVYSHFERIDISG